MYIIMDIFIVYDYYIDLFNLVMIKYVWLNLIIIYCKFWINNVIQGFVSILTCIMNERINWNLIYMIW